jgi:hypothetical protein
MAPMTAIRFALSSALLLSMAVFGCDCENDPPGTDANGDNNTGDTGEDTGNGGDTGTGDDTGTGGDTGTDEDTGTGDDTGVDPGDVGTADADGGPLEEELSEFCTGEGSVVRIGEGEGGLCAGEVAAEAFQFALCACRDIVDAQSNVNVDSFDSALGPYGAPLAGGGVNINDDGNIGVNHALVNFDAQLNLRGSIFIGGGGFGVRGASEITRNVVAAGSSTGANSVTTIGRNMFVDGDVTGRYDIAGDLYVPTGANVTQTTVTGQTIFGPVRTRLPCPCAPDEILDIAAITAYGALHNDNDETMAVTSTAWESGTGPSTITLPCGRYYITSINQPGSLRILAQGRTVLFIDGNITAQSLALDLDPGAEMDVFVNGNIVLQAASDFGQQDEPAAVRTYVGGTGAIDLSASAFFGGNLYAPRADVYFGASADLFGALVARDIHFAGSADVHFDSAIREAGDSCEEPVDTDGGVPDATPVDAGDGGTPNTCADCSECGAPSGCRADGTCGACESDADCCAPLVCIGGACQLQI